MEYIRLLSTVALKTLRTHPTTYEEINAKTSTKKGKISQQKQKLQYRILGTTEKPPTMTNSIILFKSQPCSYTTD